MFVKDSPDHEDFGSLLCSRTSLKSLVTFKYLVLHSWSSLKFFFLKKYYTTLTCQTHINT